MFTYSNGLNQIAKQANWLEMNGNIKGSDRLRILLSLSQIIGHRFVFFTRYFLSLLDDLFYAARPRLFNCCLNFKGLIQPNAACLRCLL